MESRLQEQLDRRFQEGNLRSLMPTLSCSHEIETTPLKGTNALIDFASNDYLGLARDHGQHVLVQSAYNKYLECQSKFNDQSPILGATGSRLLSGDSNLARSLETYLARIHNRRASLLFNSGYDANLSILSSLPYKKSDAIVMDELVHNSLIMGVRMGRVQNNQVFLFKHNDFYDLQRVIKGLQCSSSRQSLILVVVESVYSMDGDIAPLREILNVCQNTGAVLMVDEAHGLGIYGRTNVQDMQLDYDAKDRTTAVTQQLPHNKMKEHASFANTAGGTGVLAGLNLECHQSLFCSVHTFGKAAGCHGAVVAGSNTLVSYLFNYARPFVYSTALPPHSLISIQQAYKSMTGLDGEKRRSIVFKWVKLFRREILHGLQALNISDTGIYLLPSPSPIQALVVPGNKNCIAVCQHLRDAGHLDVYPIRSPTVPKGQERIRIILHAHNSESDLGGLIKMILISLDKLYGRSKL